MKMLKSFKKYWLVTWTLLAIIYMFMPKPFCPPGACIEGVAFWITQIFILPATWVSKILFYGFGIAGDYIVIVSMPVTLGIAYHINKHYLKH